MLRNREEDSAHYPKFSLLIITLSFPFLKHKRALFLLNSFFTKIYSSQCLTCDFRFVLTRKKMSFSVRLAVGNYRLEHTFSF